MKLDIEFYTENGLYCAYIGDNNGGSGYSIKEATQEECAKRTAEHILDLGNGIFA